MAIPPDISYKFSGHYIYEHSLRLVPLTGVNPTPFPFYNGVNEEYAHVYVKDSDNHIYYRDINNIEYDLTTGGSGSVSHNSLLGIQGGDPTNRWHLDLDQYNILTDGLQNASNPSNDGTHSDQLHYHDWIFFDGSAQSPAVSYDSYLGFSKDGEFVYQIDGTSIISDFISSDTMHFTRNNIIYENIIQSNNAFIGAPSFSNLSLAIVNGLQHSFVTNTLRNVIINGDRGRIEYSNSFTQGYGLYDSSLSSQTMIVGLQGKTESGNYQDVDLLINGNEELMAENLNYTWAIDGKILIKGGHGLWKVRALVTKISGVINVVHSDIEIFYKNTVAYPTLNITIKSDDPYLKIGITGPDGPTLYWSGELIIHKV